MPTVSRPSGAGFVPFPLALFDERSLFFAQFVRQPLRHVEYVLANGRSVQLRVHQVAGEK